MFVVHCYKGKVLFFVGFLTGEMMKMVNLIREVTSHGKSKYSLSCVGDQMRGVFKKGRSFSTRNLELSFYVVLKME